MCVFIGLRVRAYKCIAKFVVFKNILDINIIIILVYFMLSSLILALL